MSDGDSFTEAALGLATVQQLVDQLARRCETLVLAGTMPSEDNRGDRRTVTKVAGDPLTMESLAQNLYRWCRDLSGDEFRRTNENL